MLFPAAALDDAQGEKKKEQSQGHEQDDRTGVDHAPRKVMHMLEERHVGEGLGLPGGLFGKLAGENAEQEQATAKKQAHHRGSYLAPSNRRGATACGNE